MPIFFFCSNSPVHSILFHCLLLIEKLANLCCLELLAAFVLEGRQGSESRKRLANREREREERASRFLCSFWQIAADRSIKLEFWALCVVVSQ